MLQRLKNEFNRKKAKGKFNPDEELIRLHRMLKREIKRNFSGLLKLFILDTGSCSACELELQALFNPIYDVSRIGIEVVYTIEEADILLVTGLFTPNMYGEVEECYRRLKSPKHIVGIGACPMGDSPLKASLTLSNEKEAFFKNCHTIAGCPPDPKALLRGLLNYLEHL